ncbi:MAG: methyltransferase domain-containing protein [Chloroflexi bacterium]|nr:methyltransferase domain-containing protein [Chloroflexota bacterium]
MPRAGDRADSRRPAAHAAHHWRSIVRAGFHLLYHQAAWSYDAVAAIVSLGAWRGWVESCVADAAAPALEVGCGPGHLQRALWRAGIASVGLDRSPQMLRLAARPPRPPWLVHGDARSLPFADGHFASVIATFPTEVIIDPACVAELRRVLAPGGVLTVLLWAEWARDDGVTRLLDAAARHTGQHSVRTATPAARHDALADALRRAGLATTWHQRPVGAVRLHVLTARAP